MSRGSYYNEIDPYCAQWLRNLISAGHIAPGEVDERSIVDVRADDLRGFTQCHFFAGIAGWSYALRLAGWPDDRPVWTGSCPCQPFSAAGKQKGYADERHLWPAWVHLIREREPAIVFGEQVAAATEWLRLVRGDLEALGYAVGAMPVQAASAGADHLRDRYWFVAHDEREAQGGRGLQRPGESIGAIEQRPPNQFARSGDDDSGVALGDANQPGSQGRIAVPERADQRAVGAASVADAESDRRQQKFADDRGCANGSAAEQRPGLRSGRHDFEWVLGADGKARRVKPGVRLLAHGVPARVAKLRAFGNAIDPRPASQFIASLMDGDRK